MAQGATTFGEWTPAVDVSVIAPEAPEVAVVDAFDYGPILKRASYASLFGAQLALDTQVGDTGDCRTVVGGRTVELMRTDASTWVSACMTYVSPLQINIYIPPVPIGNYRLVVNDAYGVGLALSPVFWVGD